MRYRLTVLLVSFSLLLPIPAITSDSDETIQLMVICWNVESGDSIPDRIGERIQAFQGCDIWGLSEVLDQDAATIYEQAAEDGENSDFRTVLGTTGGEDRLAIIYDALRFELLRSFELDEINIEGRVRAPLVAKLKDNQTGQRFYFMVNHLYRSNNSARHQQAELLNEWIEQQNQPVIAVGDYNFDWDVEDGDQDHDSGYDLMTANNVCIWLRPLSLIATQHSANFNSILDFIFVSLTAREWQAESVIIVEENDFPDTSLTSDHRPVQASFFLPKVESFENGNNGNRLKKLLGILKTLPTGIEQLDTILDGLAGK